MIDGRLRWGDLVMLIVGLAAVGASFVLVYPINPTGLRASTDDFDGRHLLLVQAGQPVQRVALYPDRELQVAGPAGVTVIEIQAGRVRCLSSPGSQGICESAGWLEHIGELAVSVPNRLLLQIAGERTHFDSIVY